MMFNLRTFLQFLTFPLAVIFSSCVTPNEGQNPYGTISVENQTVFINEINAAGGDWIELYNGSGQTIDISGFTMIDNGSNNIPLVVPAGTVVLPDSFVVFENLPFGLSSTTSDGVNLKNASGTPVDAFTYPDGAVVDGKTIGRIPDGGTWTYSLNPTKGYSNTGYIQPVDTSQKLFINEFLSTSATSQADWIELYNRDSVNSINLEGYTLRDSLSSGSSWVIPAGFVIAPRGYIAFTNGTNFPFGLSSQTDGIKLIDPTGKMIDVYFYTTPQIADRTTGRLPDGGAWTPNLTPTKGARNLP
ncbi:MAG: lamin tail domain-containing protein [Ignavibacteria bacterium]|nr:lamin tail domain-containing protein [Ignavibacteria bacterium]